MKIIKKIISKLAKLIGYLLPIQRNKIVVTSYVGKGYGDNAKYIVEELLKHNEKIKIVWLLRKGEVIQGFPKEVNICYLGNFLWIIHLMTAKIWIDNCRKSFYFKKKKQFYIQTWHGGVALKKIEKDAIQSLSNSYVTGAQKDSKNIDVIISDSITMTKIYRNSFWYNGPILEIGAPRNDILLSNRPNLGIIKRIREKYKIEDGVKIVLYAPTFRHDYSLEVYSIELDYIVQNLEVKFGVKFVSMVRLHPNIADKSSEMDIDFSKVIDVTDYPDLQEILLVADVVITDYSSLMFDFALQRKPVFLFATDIEKYKKDRDFYISLEELPFSVAETNKELVCNILNFDKKEYVLEVNKFYQNVGIVKTGDASKKCAQLIIDIINGYSINLGGN